MAARVVLRQWPRTGSEALSMLVYKCKHTCMHTSANAREANVTQHTSQHMALGTGLALGKAEKGTQGAGERSSPAEAWRCLNLLSPKGHTGTLALEPCPSGPARLPGPAEPSRDTSATPVSPVREKKSSWSPSVPCPPWYPPPGPEGDTAVG